MIVRGIRLEPAGARARLRAEAASERSGDAFELWFEFPASLPLAAGGDPFVPALLPLAMRRRERLRVEGPVSPRLLANAACAMRLLNGWWPELGPVRVEAASERPAPRAPGRRAAAFFSGGVDSWHTLLENHGRESAPGRRVAALLSVHGLDVSVTNAGRYAAALEGAARAASATGCELLALSTNHFEVLRPRLQGVVFKTSWGMMHGPTAGALALALGGAFERVLLASTDDARRLVPRSTHPALDPLWSDEAVELVHDGAAWTKHEKVARLCAHPAALADLRVCSPMDPALVTYNCSRCLKCQGIMIDLFIEGALERASSFTGRIDPALFADFAVAPWDAAFWEDRRDGLLAKGDPLRLAGLIDAALARGREKALRPSPLRRAAYRLWDAARAASP